MMIVSASQREGPQQSIKNALPLWLFEQGPLQVGSEPSLLFSPDLISKVVAQDMARNAAAQNYASTMALFFWVLLICLWPMLPASGELLYSNWRNTESGKVKEGGTRLLNPRVAVILREVPEPKETQQG